MVGRLGLESFKHRPIKPKLDIGSSIQSCDCDKDTRIVDSQTLFSPGHAAVSSNTWAGESRQKIEGEAVKDVRGIYWETRLS